MASEEPQTSARRSPFGELLLKLRTSRGLTQERLVANCHGERISPRSITNYEKAADSPRDWVLPHRPALRVLAQAMELDPVDQHRLVTAWNTSHNMRLQHAKPNQPSTFVSNGREHELNQLQQAWRKAEKGLPQLVLLGGPAVIGKTWLVRHLSDLIAANSRKVMITWGAASGWATDVEPYLSIRTAMDRMLVEPDTASTLPGQYDSRPELSGKNVERVLQSIPTLGGALISERTLRSLASTSSSVEIEKIDSLIADRSSTDTGDRHTEFARLLEELSQSWPIVMVLEDLHWAGDPSAALILHLAQYLRNSANTPILLIITYRSNELAIKDGEKPIPLARLISAVGHSGSVTRIELNNTVTSANGKAFVEGIVNRTPMHTKAETQKLAAWIYDQTSGYPLLTSEMLRHLMETGALKQEENSRYWTFDTAAIPAAIPQGISTFVDHRLNRLSRKGRRVLELATLMDDVILTDVIADVLDMPEYEVLETIEQELVGSHHFLLTTSLNSSGSEDPTNYRIAHALIGEHIRGTLTKKRRMILHKRIAEVMEQSPDSSTMTKLGKITSHYVLAEDWAAAQMAAYRMAQESASRLDWDMAQVLFDQAEELAIKAHDPHQLWRSRAARLAIYRGLGDFETGFALGERIIQLAQQHNWPLTEALAYHHLGEIYYDLGEIDKCVECLERAIELHDQHQSYDLAAAGEAMLSHGTYRQGRYDVAHAHAVNALNFSRKTKNSWVQPEAVVAMANCEVDLGFYERAIQNYTVAVELAVMIGKLANQYIPLMNIGLCHIQMGEHKRAILDLTDLISRMEHQRLFRLSGFAIHYLGLAYEADSNWAEARTAFMRATELRRERSQVPLLFDSLSGELRVAVQLKDNARVEEILAETAERMSNHAWEGMEDPMLVMLSVATAHAYRGDAETYRYYIEQAHTLLTHRANMIEDEASLQSYLTNVPVNVDLQRRFSELNPDTKNARDPI